MIDKNIILKFKLALTNYHIENNIEMKEACEDMKQLNIIEQNLEILEEIRNTFKVEKEETINQNIYWLYIEERPILITRKIYDLVKDWLEVDKNG